MSRFELCLLNVLLAVAVGSAADSPPDLDSPVIYSLSQEAKTVAVGDLNGDGRDDLAVTAWPSGLYVLYQQDDGTLGPPTDLYAPTWPLGLAVGDLNGDSRMDLAVGGANGVIMVHFQQQDGTFGLPVVCYGYGLVNALVIDDLNGDGLADIASTSANYPIVLVAAQGPDGTFGLPSAYPVSGYNARCLCSLDYNSDGRRDLALLLSDSVCYLTGTPEGGFSAPQYVAANWAFALAAGDVTGDGRDDLAFTVPTNQPDCAVVVVPQGSNGLPESAVSYPAYDYAQPLVIADLNEDGRNDVISAHAGYEAVSALYQDSEGALGGWTVFPAPYCNGYEPGSMAVGDLDSDGHLDVAIADWWNGLVVLPHAASGSQEPLPDTTAPVCTITISGALGNNGWHVSPVTVALAAEDEPGGSGLSDIYFTLDGTMWSTYVAPIVVGAQGTTPIGYCAEDKAGNRSEPEWVSLKVDTVPPVLAIEPELTEIWPPNGAVVDVPVNVSATDSTSGIASLHLAVTDEYGLVQPETDIASGGIVAIPLVASRNDDDADGRVYTLVLTGADQAGNIAQASATVTVPRSSPDKPKKPKKPK